MNDQNFHHTEIISEIPEIFYNSKTGKPHERCFHCQKSLLESDTLYIIEKAFREGSIVFDYAVCLQCQEKTWYELVSRNSDQKLMSYFSKKIDVESRLNSFAGKHKNHIDEWLKYCLFTGKPIAECRDYQIYAQFDGDILPYVIMPYALSDEAIEEISMLLSKKTRENLKDFFRELSPSPYIVQPGDADRFPLLV